MSCFAVVGAGHAGVEGAFILANAGHQVTLWSAEAGELPYFRPRLIAVAFGQATPEAIRIKPAEAYAKAGITLAYAQVTQLAASPTPSVNGETFDGVLLANGSAPFVPPFAGTGAQRIHALWSMADARAIAAKVAPGKRLTIIGGGVLGLESALRAAMAGLRVTVIEVSPRLANGVLGDGGDGVLRAALEKKGITLFVGQSIQTINPTSITLADGTEIADDNFVLCSTGARPKAEPATSAGFRFERGICSARDLSVAPGIFVAGDVARPTEALPICAVRRAQLMGSLAAKNLLAPAGETTPWADPRLPLFMKVEDVEFHTLGDVRSPDLEERRLDDGSNPAIWQSVLYRNGQPVGLRFVGTRAGFGDWEKQLV